MLKTEEEILVNIPGLSVVEAMTLGVLLMRAPRLLLGEIVQN